MAEQEYAGVHEMRDDPQERAASIFPIRSLPEGSMRVLAAVLFIYASVFGISPHIVVAATAVIEHVGSTDPNSEGWSINPSTPDGQFGGAELTPSGNHEFWEINHSPSGQPLGYARYALSSQQLDSDWRFQARVRVVDSPGFDQVPFTMIGVRDAGDWSFVLGNDVVGVLSNTTFPSLSRSAAKDTLGDYHFYEIQFHQNGAGAGDDSADFYYDGLLLFSGVSRSEISIGPASYVFWGPADISTASDARFEYIGYIPEPNSLAAAVLLTVYFTRPRRAIRRG
jgi:hypothetical protein